MGLLLCFLDGAAVCLHFSCVSDSETELTFTNKYISSCDRVSKIIKLRDRGVLWKIGGFSVWLIPRLLYVCLHP